MPQLDEGFTVLMLTGPASVGIDTSLAQRKAEQALQSSEITISTRASAPRSADRSVNEPFGHVHLRATEVAQVNNHSITKDELAEAMSKTVRDKTPGLSHAITQPIEMRFNELLEGARADIALKIFGPDLAVLQKAQTEARAILEKIPGTGDVEFDAFGKAPVLEITLNRTNMTRYNVHATEVNKVVAAALGGANVGTFIEGNRRFEIVVRMPEEHREKLEHLDWPPLRTSDGGLIPLGRSPTFDDRASQHINREAGQRRAALRSNLRGRDVQSWVTEAQKLAARVSCAGRLLFRVWRPVQKPASGTGAIAGCRTARAGADFRNHLRRV